jgi:ATP-dependent helicase HrpA
VFIREALVDDRLGVDAPFARHNRALVAEIAGLEHKARREDVLVDEAAIAAFYAEHIPADVFSRASFERWRRVDERTDPRRLFLTREALMRHAATSVTQALYPETLRVAGADFPLAYRFAPGHPLDGLTLTVPLAHLNQVDAATLSWLVPGMIREKVAYLIKALPKAWRNRLIPIPETVTAFLERDRPERHCAEPSRDSLRRRPGRRHTRPDRVAARAEHALRRRPGGGWRGPRHASGELAPIAVCRTCVGRWRARA